MIRQRLGKNSFSTADFSIRGNRNTGAIDPNIDVSDCGPSIVAPNLETATATVNTATTSWTTGTTIRGHGSYVHYYYYYYYMIHLLCVLLVLVGVILTRSKLYTSEECDMTWSNRQFIPVVFTFSKDVVIPIPSSSWLSQLQQQQQQQYKTQYPPPAYKFYKFTDQRDPRYRSLQPILYANNSRTWCLQQQSSSSSSNIPIVVYVPGHGGSYEQSRSLGAHGIQLTRRDYSHSSHELRVYQKLTRHQQDSKESTSSLTSLEDFFFDVYAFDFGEEGGALHGWLLERQASYISDTIAALSQACNLTTVHIVAHSIGGISARLALVQYADAMKVVRNVITLGTPHNLPIWNWESSMHKLYYKLYHRQSTSDAATAIISISGGLRDEMIPPNACYVDNGAVQNESISILATDIMKRATIEGKNHTPTLGVDHRAIVWCHNLLAEVRYILHSLILSNDNLPKARIEKLRQLLVASSPLSNNYLESVSNLQQTLQVRSCHCW
jgi:hypothetical protein